MAGLELLIGMEKVSILQCEELAKEFGFDKMIFDLVGPTGKLKCKWLNAYFGIFMVVEPKQESDGFVTTIQLMFLPDLYCENLRIDEGKE